MAIAYAEETLPADGTEFLYEDRVYTVGQVVDRWGLDNLPVGTTVWDGGYDNKTRYYTRHERGWIRDDSRLAAEPQALSADYNPLRSFPGAIPPTFAGFRAKFTEAVRAAAGRFSDTHQALAEEILNSLGVNAPLIGGPVFYRTPGSEGDIAVFGEPDRERFTIFRHDGKDWVKAHGWYDDMKTAGQCRLVAGGREVDDDEAEIAAFKDAVWAAGSKAKQEHQWCSAYDRILADFGITDPDPRPDFSQWETLMKGVEARANAPEGTVLAGDRGDWGIFVKLGGEWIRKAGTRPLAAGTMRVLFDGNGPLNIPDAAVLKPFLPDARWRGDTLVAWS